MKCDDLDGAGEIPCFFVMAALSYRLTKSEDEKSMDLNS